MSDNPRRPRRRRTPNQKSSPAPGVTAKRPGGTTRVHRLRKPVVRRDPPPTASAGGSGAGKAAPTGLRLSLAPVPPGGPRTRTRKSSPEPAVRAKRPGGTRRSPRFRNPLLRPARPPPARPGGWGAGMALPPDLAMSLAPLLAGGPETKQLLRALAAYR